MLALILLGYKEVVQIGSVVEDVMGSVSANAALLVDKMGSQGVALVEITVFLRTTLDCLPHVVWLVGIPKV